MIKKLYTQVDQDSEGKNTNSEQANSSAKANKLKEILE